MKGKQINIKKITVKKSFVLVTVATIALVVGAGNAMAQVGNVVSGSASGGSGTGGKAAIAGLHVTLVGTNESSGCVRFYANGQHDVANRNDSILGRVGSGQAFTASVFRGGCAGAATRTVRYTVPTTGVTKALWTVK